MSFEDDLRRVEEHVAEARRLVQRQKGLIVRLRAAGVNTLDAKEYFGCWNRTFGDLRNTRTASEKMRGSNSSAARVYQLAENSPTQCETASATAAAAIALPRRRLPRFSRRASQRAMQPRQFQFLAL